MELRHFRCFLDVGKELYFARAAERPHIEQSPLSRHQETRGRTGRSPVRTHHAQHPVDPSRQAVPRSCIAYLRLLAASARQHEGGGQWLPRTVSHRTFQRYHAITSAGSARAVPAGGARSRDPLLRGHPRPTTNSPAQWLRVRPTGSAIWHSRLDGTDSGRRRSTRCSMRR